MSRKQANIWVFGDYRNYFQNRVTLQLLARANELADQINGRVSAVVFGQNVDEWVGEYIAHGAHTVYVVTDASLHSYHVETYSLLLARLAQQHNPDILLIGATAFGREIAPRVAKRLNTGLTADCIDLSIDANGLLVQTAPSFGGNLLADIITPHHRPQMATVRPGTFAEIPHDDDRKGDVVEIPLPDDLPKARMRVVNYERRPPPPPEH